MPHGCQAGAYRRKNVLRALVARTAARLNCPHCPAPNNVTSHPSEPAQTIRLLCVEDSPDDMELMELALERADPTRRYLLHRVDESEAFSQALNADVDVVLCDYNLPRFSPYAALQLLHGAPQHHSPGGGHAAPSARKRRSTCCAAAPRTT
jgi:CheY-like chemotaxis protein